MNSITRLILHRLASGKVRLTPIVIEVLREVSTDCPVSENPEAGASEPTPPSNESDHKKSETDNHLTFVNPLPGRWIRRTGCAALLAAGLIRATAGPDTFEAANNAFGQGNYNEAAHGFESVIAQRGYSAPVLFNLANAQQKAGQFGQAILNYERATLLSPNDPDIAANLRRAQEKAGVEAVVRSRVQKVTRWLSLNGWACLSAIAVLLIAAALPLRQLKPQTRLALNWGGVVAASVLAVAIAAIALRLPELNRAVVTAPEAVAGISPVTKAQPIFKVRAGEVVMWKRAHGDFALIQNQAGHEGWIKAGEVERIIPFSHPAQSPRS